jgi:hypothetical protein
MYWRRDLAYGMCFPCQVARYGVSAGGLHDRDISGKVLLRGRWVFAVVKYSSSVDSAAYARNRRLPKRKQNRSQHEPLTWWVSFKQPFNRLGYEGVSLHPRHMIALLQPTKGRGLETTMLRIYAACWDLLRCMNLRVLLRKIWHPWAELSHGRHSEATAATFVVFVYRWWFRGGGACCSTMSAEV